MPPEDHIKHMCCWYKYGPAPNHLHHQARSASYVRHICNKRPEALEERSLMLQRGKK